PRAIHLLAFIRLLRTAGCAEKNVSIRGNDRFAIFRHQEVLRFLLLRALAGAAEGELRFHRDDLAGTQAAILGYDDPIAQDFGHFAVALADRSATPNGVSISLGVLDHGHGAGESRDDADQAELVEIPLAERPAERVRSHGRSRDETIQIGAEGVALAHGRVHVLLFQLLLWLGSLLLRRRRRCLARLLRPPLGFGAAAAHHEERDQEQGDPAIHLRPRFVWAVWLLSGAISSGVRKRKVVARKSDSSTTFSFWTVGLPS